MRRWSWILWLLIALMPVRGIAQSLMTFAPANAAAVAAAPTDAPPCPMHVAVGDAAAATSAEDSGNGTPSQVCSLCNVCHSAVLPLALAVSAASAIPDAEPLPAHGLGAGRAAPSELFRPPR
jgi:cytochrome c5